MGPTPGVQPRSRTWAWPRREEKRCWPSSGGTTPGTGGEWKPGPPVPVDGDTPLPHPGYESGMSPVRVFPVTVSGYNETVGGDHVKRTATARTDPTDRRGPQDPLPR